MIKFENYYAYDSREIDYVVDHIIERSSDKIDSIRVVLGELCKLLSDDQQKSLVVILNNNINIHCRTYPYEWTPVLETTENN